jgi:hypothetical protein
MRLVQRQNPNWLPAPAFLQQIRFGDEQVRRHTPAGFALIRQKLPNVIAAIHLLRDLRIEIASPLGRGKFAHDFFHAREQFVP